MVSVQGYLKLMARAQIGRTLGRRLDPSDLVQETFLEAFRDFHRFQGHSEKELLAWLRRILTRNLIDHLRGARPRTTPAGQGREESLEALLERSSTTLHEALARGISTPSAQAARREESVVLADLLERLPEDRCHLNGLALRIARGEGEPASRAGASVAGAGDVNGDGIPDLIVGGVHCPYSCYSTPTYVVLGKRDGEAVELAEVQAGRGGFAIRGSAAGDRSGRSVSGAGDVDGDGLADDLLIASGLADARYPSLSGAAYVVFGPREGPRPPRFRRGAARGEEALDISDAIRLLGFLFLGDAAPPDPCPTTCGPDPTEDDLACATATRGCAP